MRIDSKESIQLLRHELRQLRGNIPPAIRINHDQAIQQHLLQMIKSQAITSVACYWPFDGEPDLLPLCRQLMNDDCEIALPVISTDDSYNMKFYRWDTSTTLRKNRYGISEPQKTDAMPLAGFDMLLMPLVAYDKTGKRMGMGSGYYDRHLESLREARRPLRIGVAYSSQEIAHIRSNDWDIPLHRVVTEHGWSVFD